MSSTKTKPYVYHPARGDEPGVIIADERRKAWTPDDLTKTAPDAGMVRVRWSGTFDPTALYWEYLHELTTTPPTAQVYTVTSESPDSHTSENLGTFPTYRAAYRAVWEASVEANRFITLRGNAVDGGPGRVFVTDDGFTGQYVIIWDGE